MGLSVASGNPPDQQLFGGVFARLEGRPAVQSVLALCLFAIAFYFAYRYAMTFSHATAAPFWFPDSVLLCTFLLVRPRWWWLFLLSTLPIRLLVAVPPGTPSWFLICAFGIDSSRAVIAALLLRRFLADPIRFGTVREFGIYCAVAVLLVPAVGALGGAAMRQVLGNDYWMSWSQWFLGDALANLIITPVLFYWVLRPAQPRDLAPVRWFEVALLTCGLLVSTSLAFDEASSGLGFADARSYAPIPFLFWAAIRFGMFGASGAVGLLSVAAVAAALSGRGPFAGRSPGDTAESLQQFLLLRAAPLYVVAVLIEQMREVERSLRESEQRFRYLADTAPVFIWMTGTDRLCEFFNKGWLDFTGRTLEQESGFGWTEGVHPDDLLNCIDEYHARFDAREPFQVDYRMRRYDGHYRWILGTGVPRFGAKGEFLGYIGSAIDVTDRRAQEAALRESEERYREVVESQTDFVCRFLPDMTLTFVNAAYCRFFERAREDLLGTRLAVFAPESARAFDESRNAPVGMRQEPYVWDCEVLRGGSLCWQHWVCHAIFGTDGQLREYQAIGHDITDRKHAEESDRKLAHGSRLAALGELTAMVAHEINQPLSAILNNAEAAEMLLDRPDPPLDEIRQILADICRDDTRAYEAIRSIRTLMQKREVKLQPVDLNQTVTDVLRLAAGDALSRRVHIRHELAGELPPVTADRAYLEQVLLNLIVNGMDAMKETSELARQLTVQTRHNGADSVEVVVMDCGHGIPADKLPQLFDSFFTTKPDGMGLGLSLARSVIQAHQGRIWAENREGGGAAFHFTIRAATDRPIVRMEA